MRIQRRYEDDVEVIQLTDAAHHVEVSMVPSVGNTIYEMKVGGAIEFRQEPHRPGGGRASRPAVAVGAPRL